MVPSTAQNLNLKGSKSLSRTFLFTIPGWWNDPPNPIWNAGTLSIFKQQLKTCLFDTNWLNPKLKKNFIFIFIFLSFPC